MFVGGLNFLEQKLTAGMIKGGSGNIFGRPYSVPLNATKGAGVKGLVDTFTGGPLLSGFLPKADSYGSGDSDHDGRPDGEEYVDKSQPHR
jgi:hypothetical protein